MDLHNRSNQFMLDNEGTRCHRHESILHFLPHPFPIWPDRAGKVMDVENMIQEQFEKQMPTHQAGPVIAHPLGKNTRLWDVENLWKPVNPVFCLACDTVFIDRQRLEEHVCPFVSFICSCGVSFCDYTEMWAHSSSHNHKASYVLNHKNAMENRIISVKEQESKLKVLEETAKNIGIVKDTVPFALSPAPKPRYTTGQTVKLWWRFRPIVRLETFQRFYNGRKYMCATCHDEIGRQDQLIEHVDTHSKTCIYGCSHCGILLISSVPPKPHHRCGSFQASPSKRFTTGQVQIDPLSAETLYKPYTCQHCSLKFGHPIHLRNHVKINHINITKVRGANGEQQTLDNMPNRTSQKVSLGYAQVSVQLPRQHWCTRKQTLFRPETVVQMAPSQAQQRSDPYASAHNKGGSEMTLQFQDLSNIKTYGNTNLLTIKTKQVVVIDKITQTEFSPSLSMKSDPELHDNEYGVEKTTEMNRLLQVPSAAIPVLKN